MELWKPVGGYEGLYEVSNFGRIKSLSRQETFSSALGKIVKRSRKGRIIIQSESKGYLRAHMCKNGVVKITLVHRMVGLAFIPNPYNYPEINHKNGIRSDNRVENLEWCTTSQNMRHSYDVLKRKISPNVINVFGGDHPASTPILQFDLNGNFIREWPSAIEIQRALSVNSPNVIACCRGKQQTCGGFSWKHKYERKIRQKSKQ